MAPIKDRFANAFQFLASYFHEDFGVEFEQPEQATQKFIEDTDAEGRASVVKELRQVLSDTCESDLSDALFALGCYYSPERHRGQGTREWLDQTIRQIEASLIESKH